MYSDVVCFGQWEGTISARDRGGRGDIGCGADTESGGVGGGGAGGRGGGAGGGDNDIRTCGSMMSVPPGERGKHFLKKLFFKTVSQYNSNNMYSYNVLARLSGPP